MQEKFLVRDNLYCNPITTRVSTSTEGGDVIAMTLEEECEKYKDLYFEDLNRKYGTTINAAEFDLEIDKWRPRYRYYGSKKILKRLDSAIDKCNDKYIVDILRKIRELMKVFLQLRPCCDEDQISQILEQVKTMKNSIREYFELQCCGCHDKLCMEGIRKALSGLPYRNLLFGVFRPHSREIVIYVKSIEEKSNNGDQIRSKIFSTLAHETFHAYHYGLCCDLNDAYHWFESESRFGDDDEEENENMDNLEQRRFHDQNRDEDECNSERTIAELLSGPPSDADIVKESLASYYEYYSDLYGWNKTMPEAGVIANNLEEAWKNNDVSSWPYAGAKAFLNDRSDISSDKSVFRDVLFTSVYDWETACDIILKNER